MDKLTDIYEWNHVHSTDDCSLTATPLSFEEQMERENKIQRVIDLLEAQNIKVKTEYGYYRPLYCVLEDIANRWEELSKDEVECILAQFQRSEN